VRTFCFAYFSPSIFVRLPSWFFYYDAVSFFDSTDIIFLSYLFISPHPVDSSSSKKQIDLPVLLGFRHPWEHAEDPFAPHVHAKEPDEKDAMMEKWDAFSAKAMIQREVDDDEDEEEEEEEGDDDDE